MDDSSLEPTLALFKLDKPGSFPFTTDIVLKIQERRKQLNGQLFIDYLLSQAGVVEPTRVFPPKDEDEFKSLLRMIWESEWGVNSHSAEDAPVLITASGSPARVFAPNRNADLTASIKRACLVYYLLAWWHDSRHWDYSQDKRISGQFAELTHAYFLLDIGKAAEATSLLCTPLITPDPTVSEKIFHALEIATDADPDVLVLRYARMAKPVLAPEEVLHLYLRSLARINFLEAWISTREYAEEQREQLLGVVLDAVLSPRPIKPALHLLTNLPFHSLERSFLITYTLTPPTHIPEPSLAALQSLVILRLSYEGNYTEAVRLNKEYAQYADKLLNHPESISSPTVGTSFKGAKKGGKKVPHSSDSVLDAGKRPGFLLAQKAEEWRETLRESVALLPLEHRRILEGKLYESSLGALGSFAGVSSGAGDRSFANSAPGREGMDMGWDDLEAEGLESTPPPTQSATQQGKSPMPPSTPAGRPVPSTSTPSRMAPPSSSTPSRLGPRKSDNTPIETQTLGKVLKPPTPRRQPDYLMPFRTPTNNSMAGDDSLAELSRGIGDRSMAPPLSSGRANAKNAFQDIEGILGSIKGTEELLSQLRESVGIPATGPGSSSTVNAGKQKRAGEDVEMQDGDETESADDLDLLVPEDEEDNSILRAAGRNLVSGASSLLVSQVLGVRKTQERQRAAAEQHRSFVAEESARNRKELEQRRLSAIERRARMEHARKSLGEGSSFEGKGFEKRKRTEEDAALGKEDFVSSGEEDEREGKRLRKADGGVVRKSLGGEMEWGKEGDERRIRGMPSTSGRRMDEELTSQSEARGPPSTAAPSMSTVQPKLAQPQPTKPPIPLALAKFLQPVSLEGSARRSSRLSNASGSQAGTGTEEERPPTLSPAPSEDETVDEDEEKTMPGAYVMSPDEEETSTRKTRKKPASQGSTKKPAKASSKKPASSGSAGGTKKRTTRSTGVSVPAPIAEDAVLETADEDAEPSPTKRTAARRTAQSKGGKSKVNVQPAMAQIPGGVVTVADVVSPIDGGERRSRRLAASAPTVEESTNTSDAPPRRTSKRG